MIPKECKRLAEVDFPIAVVSRVRASQASEGNQEICEGKTKN